MEIRDEHDMLEIVRIMIEGMTTMEKIDVVNRVMSNLEDDGSIEDMYSHGSTFFRWRQAKYRDSFYFSFAIRNDSANASIDDFNEVFNAFAEEGMKAVEKIEEKKDYE